MNDVLQVDMVTAARDDSSTQLAKNNAELLKMEAQLKATAGASSKSVDASKNLTAAQRLEATQVGKASKGFQDLTGKVTGFLGAATFAAGAVAGVVAAFIELIPATRSLDEIIDESVEALRKQSAQLAAVTEATRKAADAYLDLAAARDGELAADLAAERAVKTEKDRELALKGRIAVLKEISEVERQSMWVDEGRAAALRRQIAADQERLKNLEGVAGRENRVLNIRHRLERNAELLGRLEGVRLERAGKLAELEGDIAKAMGDQVTAAAVLAFVGPRVEDAGPAPRQRSAGGARPAAPSPGADMAAAMAWEHERFLEEQSSRTADAEEAVKDYAARLAWAHKGFTDAEKARAAEQAQSAKDATAAEKAALEQRLQAYMAFAAGLDVYREATGSLSEISPGLARVADGLADIGKHAFIAANATDGATEAIFGLVAASGKTALSLVKDTRARALGEALLYTGLATAAAFTPGMQWQAVGYGLAAAQLFVAAGQPGKKSASVAAAAAANDNTVGGAITNVYNLGSGGRDVIGQAHLDRRLAGEQRHTGYDQRAAGW